MTDIYAAEDKTMPAVCYALYLIAFATGPAVWRWA